MDVGPVHVERRPAAMLASAARCAVALGSSGRTPLGARVAAASCAGFSSKSSDDDVYSDLDDVYAKEGISHDGEWAGCTRRFLPPIKIAVRGSEILTNPLCECCAAVPPCLVCLQIYFRSRGSCFYVFAFSTLSPSPFVRSQQGHGYEERGEG